MNKSWTECDHCGATGIEEKRMHAQTSLVQLFFEGKEGTEILDFCNWKCARMYMIDTPKPPVEEPEVETFEIFGSANKVTYTFQALPVDSEVLDIYFGQSVRDMFPNLPS